jgi:hypothetical protein
VRFVRGLSRHPRHRFAPSMPSKASPTWTLHPDFVLPAAPTPLVPKVSRHTLPHSTLFESDTTLTTHTLAEMMKHFEYYPGFEALNGLLLYSPGLVHDSDGTPSLQVCNTCLNELEADTTPSLSVANDNYCGPQHPALEGLTLAERHLIAVQRCVVVVTLSGAGHNKCGDAGCFRSVQFTNLGVEIITADVQHAAVRHHWCK